MQSDSERRLLQDEDHSGSRPHSFPGLFPSAFRDVSGADPERPCISGFRRNSSNRDRTPKM